MDTHALIPILLLEDLDISPGAKLLAGLLSTRHVTGQPVVVSTGLLAEKLGVSRSTMKRQIRELEVHGWLQVHEISGGPNGYQLLRYP